MLIPPNTSLLGGGLWLIHYCEKKLLLKSQIHSGIQFLIFCPCWSLHPVFTAFKDNDSLNKYLLKAFRVCSWLGVENFVVFLIFKELAFWGRGDSKQ